MPHRHPLLSAAQSFCTAFSTSQPPSTLLSHFSTHPTPSVHEYGLPILAPFLGRTFTGRGREGVRRYFELIAEHMAPLPPAEGGGGIEFDGWMVDTERAMVSVLGKARFVWKSTGDEWDEVFCYRLKMVEEEGGEWKVEEYRIWADTGAAYLASQGKLERPGRYE
ncbi:hypothetical protein FQN54_001541 [Arachnomyces sp. PD_36]|nr:hypothetical protein FQN54_001541 [Arachnomyces sp. PD_36]